LREFQGAARFPGLGVSASADRAPYHDERRVAVKGAPSARQADQPRSRLARMRGTGPESVNELGGVTRQGGEGCWGFSPQVAGQPGPLPLARERNSRGPLPAAPMPRTWPQHTPP
jgi:hypothetical protein